MIEVILALIICFLLYNHFTKKSIINVNPPIEQMKNTKYRCNDHIYKLSKINKTK